MKRKMRAGVAFVAVAIVLGVGSALLYGQDQRQGQNQGHKQGQGQDQDQDQDHSRDDQPVTVLILGFDNATGRASLEAVSQAVPDLLAAYLSGGAGPVRVVDRRALEAVYQEKALTWQGLVEGRSESHPGVLAQARYIVRGSLSRPTTPGHPGHPNGGPDGVELKAFIHETATTRLLKVVEARGGAGEIPRLCRQAASGIAAHFQAKLPPIEDLPLDADPDKSLWMIHGLNAYHHGQPHRALAAFLKILDDHPDDEPARYWLTKCFLAAGMEPHARIEAQEYLNHHAHSPRASQVRDLLRSLDSLPKESDSP